MHDPDTPRIVPVDPAAPAVRWLLRRSDEYMAALYPPEANRMASVRDLKSPNVVLYGCWEGETLAGCGAAKVMEDDGRYGEIKRLFVEERYRGRGMSTLLMARLEDHLRDLAVEWIRLETGVSQPEALGLFEKRGYTQRGPFGTYEENGWSVFFEKRLFHNPQDA